MIPWVTHLVWQWPHTFRQAGPFSPAATLPSEPSGTWSLVTSPCVEPSAQGPTLLFPFCLAVMLLAAWLTYNRIATLALNPKLPAVVQPSLPVGAAGLFRSSPDFWSPPAAGPQRCLSLAVLPPASFWLFWLSAASLALAQLCLRGCFSGPCASGCFSCASSSA